MGGGGKAEELERCGGWEGRGLFLPYTADCRVRHFGCIRVGWKGATLGKLAGLS